MRRCVGGFHEKGSVLRWCIDGGEWLVLDPFVGGGKQRAQVSVEELSDTSVCFPVVGALELRTDLPPCFWGWGLGVSFWGFSGFFVVDF